MTDQILSLFDEALSSKCWVGKYGRLAITGKQSVGQPARFKRFPVSCSLAADCENLAYFLTDLLPDDTKSGVAFWKTVSPLSYQDAPGISSHRRIKKAETTLEFVVWVNVRKVTGENSSASWCSDQGNIIRDAIKTIDCKKGVIVSGLDYIKHLKIEIIQIGNTETFRRAMSEYSIENIEALTVWPYSAFTITVKMSFMVASNCIPSYECSTEINCTDIVTYYIIDEIENKLWDGSSNLIHQQ